MIPCNSSDVPFNLILYDDDPNPSFGVKPLSTFSLPFLYPLIPSLCLSILHSQPPGRHCVMTPGLKHTEASVRLHRVRLRTTIQLLSVGRRTAIK